MGIVFRMRRTSLIDLPVNKLVTDFFIKPVDMDYYSFENHLQKFNLNRKGLEKNERVIVQDVSKEFEEFNLKVNPYMFIIGIGEIIGDSAYSAAKLNNKKNVVNIQKEFDEHISVHIKQYFDESDEDFFSSVAQYILYLGGYEIKKDDVSDFLKYNVDFLKKKGIPVKKIMSDIMEISGITNMLLDFYQEQ